MKKIKLQLQDIDGVVEIEKEMQINDEDTLIMQIPKDMSFDEAHRAFEIMELGLSKGGLIALPNTIGFSLIKKL
jgi:hypothetical protein